MTNVNKKVLAFRKKIAKSSLVKVTMVLAFMLIAILSIEKWHDHTVAKSSSLCAEISGLVYTNIHGTIEEYYLSYRRDSISFRAFDSLLSLEFDRILIDHQDFEGGFYLAGSDKFLGYSYPTSDPPKPIYGPAPRSYNIIRDQCRKTILDRKSQLEIHRFNPAMFPLSTQPVEIVDEIIGCIWTRVHIEKDLPLVRLQSILNFTVIFLILVLVLTIWFLNKVRRNVEMIKQGLNKIHDDPTCRLEEKGKMFREIVKSVNETLDKLQFKNQQNRELERKLVQEEKMASIGKIVAGVAHEVRTPLAIIKTRVQMWKMKLEDNEGSSTTENKIMKDSIDLVITETDRLSNLVKRLILISKPINKKLEWINIRELILDSVKIVKIQMGNPAIIFTIFEEDFKPVEGDKNALQQVFVNILMNSAESMPEGGVISIRADVKKDAFLNIEISDEGQGIPEEAFNRIFDLFFTTKSSGVGLGLSISREIISSHRGDIRFENLQTKGVRCTIQLPFTQNQPNE